ncbi:MAG: putative hydrolase or acyltransferase of alpha/beta superfamily, partial [Acidimicrobiia bacterium]|nr:putative hydrolase or acyltransferase of alpha/beta superfamily [Acidimicrobiia bacterium]
GARPQGRLQYRLSECVDDVFALADAAGVQRFHLVGHDWGGAVAWAAAYLKPERLLSVAVLATPHPRAMLRSMVTSTQALRSSYMVLFQLPAVPEWMMLANGAAPLRRQLESSGLPPAFATSYVAQLREPGALTAALNWYRAMPLTAGFAAVGRIRVPTLYMWGSNDGFLGAAAAHGTRRWIDGPYRYMELDGVSHWIPETEPTLVATALAEHFSAAAKH